MCSMTVLSMSVYADGSSHELPEMQLTDILVSALYFIGVLLLIYLVLTLVSKWGKKHSDSENGGERKDAEIKARLNAPEKAESKAETDITDKAAENIGSNTQKEEKF